MKTFIGIFAHPDDEAFGPSGTIAMLSKENNVYLICATNGESASGVPDPLLGKIRQEELRASAKILGVKDIFFLNYPDGELRNSIYHEVAEKIEKICEELCPQVIITIEPRGISGHIDHIFVSMVSSFVFQKTACIEEIWYHCISRKASLLVNNYFIYFPPGYDNSEIDKTVDVSGVLDEKIQAIKAHASQKNDVKWILKSLEIFPKEEYFLVTKK